MFTIPMPDWLPGFFQSLGDVKSYGVMMMLAFLTGIWLSCRRAFRSQADPDIVLNIGFIGLIFGVAGARAMFVIHYWDTRFANTDSPIAAIFDIRAGGLEFWGGPILVIPAVIIYLRYIARASVRWYIDITVPALASGLAITRIGCFLNGCCWGAVCVDQHDPAGMKASVPWAVQFPYGSPAMRQQYEFGQLTLPKELIYTSSSGQSYPIARDFIDAALKEGSGARQKLDQAVEAAKKEVDLARQSGADAAMIQDLNKVHADASQKLVDYLKKTEAGLVQQQCITYGLTIDQLVELASHYQSKPVHPTQLYAVINALLIAWLLSTIFYYRRRHGILLGLFLLIYSVSRVFEEAVRQDNPLDVGGVTISQAVSIVTFIGGVFWLIWMYRLPMMSPRAVPFIPPEEETAPPKASPARK
ncbi:MAG TPA: prolipoprotein diacylglyceryl transferase [Phycisphaerae bacterium]|nr:prolipoprotein diacylglyceryl transferase [Phycisphaerae bacterium]